MSSYLIICHLFQPSLFDYQVLSPRHFWLNHQCCSVLLLQSCISVLLRQQMKQILVSNSGNNKNWLSRRCTCASSSCSSWQKKKKREREQETWYMRYFICSEMEEGWIGTSILGLVYPKTVKRSSQTPLLQEFKATFSAKSASSILSLRDRSTADAKNIPPEQNESTLHLPLLTSILMCKITTTCISHHRWDSSTDVHSKALRSARA